MWQCCGSGIRIFQGQKKIPDPDPHKIIEVFLTQIIVSKLWEI
jgi:hypothetical protein